MRLTERGWKVQHALLRLSAAFEERAAEALGAARWGRLRDLLEDLALWVQHSAER